MAFEFGVIDNIEPGITVTCLVIVVLFILFFEYSIGITEYLFEGSPVYNIMIKAIYKELMLMGIISFIVVMIEAGQEDLSTTGENWLSGIDFIHILIFYMTIFFVINAFYLMRTSLITSKLNRRYYCEQTSELIKEVKTTVIGNFWYEFRYNMNYLPLSNIRDRVEFKLVHSLFRDTYLLPANFDFPSYISGCFDR